MAKPSPDFCWLFRSSTKARDRPLEPLRCCRVKASGTTPDPRSPARCRLTPAAGRRGRTIHFPTSAEKPATTRRHPLPLRSSCAHDLPGRPCFLVHCRCPGMALNPGRRVGASTQGHDGRRPALAVRIEPQLRSFSEVLRRSGPARTNRVLRTRQVGKWTLQCRPPGCAPPQEGPIAAAAIDSFRPL